ncbi:hypothetical protein LEP1GSC124_1582 [Leptospira interrogans serovar Pyrogenes str. 200701872]|uniref:Uncharacterized protein n=1 Tax=Leptospira interrogans serovar Pyrogenes str. 200701872 TaxID=1193029 RepID=M6ZSV9_LEPIR|nr:hypothetical protein LEP1GSC124_1582 [Leptospira interrogans serovar Pyrogenes str. 200701872]
MATSPLLPGSKDMPKRSIANSSVSSSVRSSSSIYPQRYPISRPDKTLSIVADSLPNISTVKSGSEWISLSFLSSRKVESLTSWAESITSTTLVGTLLASPLSFFFSPAFLFLTQPE